MLHAESGIHMMYSAFTCNAMQVLFEAQGRSAKGKAVELEDMKFHQCVRLARFENDRTISFIPPDGAFDLMCVLSAETVPDCMYAGYSSSTCPQNQGSCSRDHVFAAACWQIGCAHAHGYILSSIDCKLLQAAQGRVSL